MFALSLLLVFLILAALYESWSLPFSILLTAPVSILTQQSRIARTKKLPTTGDLQNQHATSFH